MNNSQARRNLIALQRGEHCHDYAQVLIGWRGRMDCEFSASSGRLTNGTAALVPASAGHLYAGLSEESELLVIDVSLDLGAHPVERLSDTVNYETVAEAARAIAADQHSDARMGQGGDPVGEGGRGLGDALGRDAMG